MRSFQQKILLLGQSTPFILCALMLMMFLVRVVPIYHSIFTDWIWWHGKYVNFASDDAVYHMRLVFNTLQHFPSRIFFDPFTHFPYGNQIHFGPVFTYLLATPAWILGCGHPSDTLINAVGAFVPPILGALCIIPTYYVGKNIFNRTAGLLAATTLAFLPGEFFVRSTLGFADHHVAEVLFSTWIFAFLAIFFKKVEEKQKKSNCYKFAILAGIFLGLYLLTWPAAFLVTGILLFFFIGEFFLIYKKDHRYENILLLLAAALYLIPALMVLPYSLQNLRFQITYYSLAQPVLLVLHFLVVLLLYSIFKICKRKHSFKWTFSIVLLTSFTLIILVIKIFAPSIYDAIFSGIKLLFSPNKGMLTVAEVWPSIINRQTGNISFANIFWNLRWIFPLCLFALPLLIEKTYKENKPNYFLFVIWTFGMLEATFAQERFAYYLAINAALLTGYLGNTFFRYMYTYYLNPTLSNVSSSKFWCALICCGLFITAIIYPALPYVNPWVYGPRISKTWYDAYFWLHENTPNSYAQDKNTGFSYLKGFFPIPKDIKLKYFYPIGSYGIVVWWPIGHQLTYIAERIPTSNPFQQGIVNSQNPSLGAAPFFTTTSEKQAISNLKTLNARYVLIDTATVTIEYPSMLLWENKKYDNWQNKVLINKQFISRITNYKKNEISFDAETFKKSMLYRLFYLDANSLEHMRLIAEFGDNYIVNLKAFNTKTGNENLGYIVNKNSYKSAIQLFHKSQQPAWLDDKKETLIYDARPPTKTIKIFEKVRGAQIIGKAANGTIVHLYLNLLIKTSKPEDQHFNFSRATNSQNTYTATEVGRNFVYTQTTIAKNGSYKFIVPYPTSHISGKGYDCSIEPLGPYVIKFGKNKKRLFITEKEIQGGASKIAI